jgi:vancomycin resistance protein YoaR
VEPGRAISFLAAIGEISTAAGYLPGPAVRGGEVVSDEVGGGVCTVATLLYRAAWAAGLPILERRGHSRWLAAFADRPGLDAAVATPGPDLRVLNDTGSRLYVAAAAQGGRATLTLWGRGDGRTATLAPPRLVEEAQIEVVNARVVRSAAGAVLRRERVVTRYER